MLRPIETEEEYDEALTHLYELMQTDVKEGSQESNELEELSILVKDYELIKHPVPSPSH
jgi:HTH-type transcriptional regulator/antitoxin HigA